MASATQPKAKKSAATALKKSKSSPSHPPFFQMITDAIVSLKERTGSSQYAITKFIEEKHKQLPSTFRKLLLHHLKKSVAAGKLVKVKNSFKLPPTRSAPVKTDAAPKKPKPAKATAASKSKTKTAVAKTERKPKLAAKPKAKAAAKTTPAKKVASKPARKAPAKSVKKPKSVKSPAKKAKK